MPGSREVPAGTVTVKGVLAAAVGMLRLLRTCVVGRFRAVLEVTAVVVAVAMVWPMLNWVALMMPVTMEPEFAPTTVEPRDCPTTMPAVLGTVTRAWVLPVARALRVVSTMGDTPMLVCTEPDFTRFTEPR